VFAAACAAVALTMRRAPAASAEVAG